MHAELDVVALGLLARRGLEPHDRGLARDPVLPREVFEYRDLAGVALGADLVEQTTGGHLGEVVQALEQVALVGVELARHIAAVVIRGTVSSQGRFDRVARDPELPRDRADRDARLLHRNDVHPFLQPYQLTPPRHVTVTRSLHGVVNFRPSQGDQY